MRTPDTFVIRFSSGWQWPLTDGTEVHVYTRASECLAVLPGTILIALLRLYLDNRRGGPLAADPAPRRPLARLPARQSWPEGFSAEQRTQFRQRRRARAFSPERRKR